MGTAADDRGGWGTRSDASDGIVFVEIDGRDPDDLAEAPFEPTLLGEVGRHAVDGARESIRARRDELAAQRRALQLDRLSAKHRPHAAVGVDRPRRTGHVEEVVVTLATPPAAMRRAAVGERLHSTVAGRLEIDRNSRRIMAREVRWRARLRTGPLRHRWATLRFYTSPSTNVSVLSLVPARPHRVYTGAFIRAGLRALGEMTAQLDARGREPDVDAGLAGIRRR
jgi:hypothetical protein